MQEKESAALKGNIHEKSIYHGAHLLDGDRGLYESSILKEPILNLKSLIILESIEILISGLELTNSDSICLVST